MDNMYREYILDHGTNPRNRGVLTPADIDHEEKNHLCGDRLRLTIQFDADHRIAALNWDGEGCVISQATASMLSEDLIGQTVNDLASLTRQDVLDLLGIPLTMNREKCALLSLRVIKTALFGVEEWQRTLDEE